MATISTSLNPARKAYGVVSYRGIPLYRCQAWALELVKEKGVTPCIISGIRDDAIIAQHNKQFGTHLHGQQYLVDLFHAGKGNPANTPQTTSHCHHADGNRVYGPSGTNIPLVKNGIDACDNATASRIVAELNHLGFRAVQPYNSGSELHHFSLWPYHTNDYIRRLRRHYTARLARKVAKRAATRVSARGIALIKKYEGFRAWPYRLGDGVTTIGYGETKGITMKSGPWGEAYAAKKLKERVDRDYAPAVKKLGVKLNQNQFDAITSAVYNLGPGVLDRGRSLGAALRSKQDHGYDARVAAALRLYSMPGTKFHEGLLRRRNEEAALFSRPIR